MNRGIISLGCFFTAIAAFLYATKHITAAIMSAHINSPDVTYFTGAYELIGFGITFWTVFSLLLGMILLVVGMFPNLKSFLLHKHAK